MLKFLCVILAWSMWLESVPSTNPDTVVRRDSLRLKDTVHAVNVVPERSITFEPFGERLGYLLIAIVTVGGFAFLLNKKRLDADRKLGGRGSE